MQLHGVPDLKEPGGNTFCSVAFIEQPKLIFGCVMPLYPVNLRSPKSRLPAFGDGELTQGGLETSKLAVGVQLVSDGALRCGRGFTDEAYVDHCDLIFMVGFENST